MRKRTWHILALALLLGLARGMLEGMIMYTDGPRLHVAFYMYHILSATVLIGWGALVLAVVTSRPRLVLVIGAALLMWETTELGYTLSRTVILYPAYEHIVILDAVDWYITGWAVAGLHAARAICGTVLSIAGGLK